MFDRLPDYIDPVSFAEKGRELEGVLVLSLMPRLSEMLVPSDDSVKVHLQFVKDDKVTHIKGSLAATLQLTCCVCLEAIEFVIDQNFDLTVVTSSEEIDLLPKDLEPFLLEGDSVAVKNIIEDELLLILPDFPRHSKNCRGFNNPQDVKPDMASDDSDNPFSVLAKLKK